MDRCPEIGAGPVAEERVRNQRPLAPIKKYSQSNDRVVSVRAVVRQDVNFESLAKVLVAIAKQDLSVRAAHHNPGTSQVGVNGGGIEAELPPDDGK